MKIFYLILITVISFSFTSCDDYSSTLPGDEIIIAGKLVSGGSPLSGFKINLNGNEATTNSDGSFNLITDTLPYDLMVSSQDGSSVWIYKNFSNISPYINIALDPQIFHCVYSAQLNFMVPPLNTDERVLSLFIPDVGQEKVEVVPSTNLSQPQLTVEWNESASITGSWILLYYTFSGDKITSFNKYYEKRLTINHNQTFYDTIQVGDPFVDPVDSYIRGSVNNPYGTNQDLNVRVYFTSPLILNDLSIENTNTQNFDFVVPGGLPVDLGFAVEAVSSISTPLTTNKVNVIAGTENNVIQLLRAPELVSPKDYGNITFHSSAFSWTIGDGEGIYEMNLYPSLFVNPNIKIYTSSPDAVINNKQIPYIGNGERYQWKITKFYGSGSLDQFFTKEAQQETFVGKSISDFRIFYSY